MIACYRAVSAATSDDDNQPPGGALAEALELAREPSNIKRLVENAVKKLTSPSVIVRVKALRFLSYLAQNGPSGVIGEIRLNTTALSDCMGFRGPPHKKRGYEPYQEMKDAAQTLLDLSFAATTTQISSFSQPGTAQGPIRSFGSSTMQSVGSTVVKTTAPSIEPRNIDPNARDLAGQIGGFFKKTFGEPEKPKKPPPEDPLTGLPAVPPPRPDMLERLQGPELDWSKKKRSNPVIEKPPAPTDTPTAKLLKVPGGRALPTNGELSAFKGALTPDSLPELKQGLRDPDWKVKLRAIGGLECFGEKYGFGTVADLKDQVEAIKAAPQSSLRTAATRFDQIKNKEPLPPPEEPSAFNLGGDGDDGNFEFENGNA
jgi:hypothetical protein